MMTYTRLSIAIVALLGCAGSPCIVWAADPASKPGAAGSGPESLATSIKGKVLTIEPDALVLATEGGGQVRLKLNKDTKMERALKAGDSVDAEIGPEHQAVNLRLSDSAQGAMENEQKGTERK
jgi:hypothetical protein